MHHTAAQLTLDHESPKYGPHTDGRSSLFTYPGRALETLSVIIDGTEHPLRRSETGGFEGLLDVGPGARYLLSVNGGEHFPDPFSRYQPEGVMGPSEICDPKSFTWTDTAWAGLPNHRGLVLYEMHIGTCGGTFKKAAEQLERLASLGVDAILVMPINQFVGRWNWGYDGVQLFAPHNTYGTPDDFKYFVNRAHQAGLGVVLDVVYNHLGPEGNYVWRLIDGLYQKKEGPWGALLDFTKREARDFVIGNALYWTGEFHVDGLRLDAVHCMEDDASPEHIVTELCRQVHAKKPGTYIVAEHPGGDPRLHKTRKDGGFGLSGYYDDAKFGLPVTHILTGDARQYLKEFKGFTARELAAGLNGLTPQSLAMFCNHDWVGNRPPHNRPETELPLDAVRTEAAIMMLPPGSKMIFQGQEYAEQAPFPYIREVLDPNLARAIREGRERENAEFFVDGQVPDPFSEATYRMATLSFDQLEREPGISMSTFYANLISLFRSEPLLSYPGRHVHAEALGNMGLRVSITCGAEELVALCNLGKEPLNVPLDVSGSDADSWEVIFDSERWAPDGHPARVTLDGAAPSVEFAGRGAVFLKKSDPLSGLAIYKK
jgi:maltooligosyltrehalose trehalohydrolase